MRRLRSDDAEPQNLVEGDWSARRCASTVIGTIVILIGASIIVVAVDPNAGDAVVAAERRFFSPPPPPPAAASSAPPAASPPSPPLSYLSRLNARFRNGGADGTALADAGVLVHVFDGAEAKKTPWSPASDAWESHAWYWSFGPDVK